MARRRKPDPFVRVRGARTHNLCAVDVDIPRDVHVAFTGVSGSGKSSLAFGTIYAEAQRRYFESVAPYARRLLHPALAPDVDAITGLPPAVALQQRRTVATARSSVGTLTATSNLLRLLYSRAGTYPAGAERLDAEAFSPNSAAGACPQCHGLGRTRTPTERSMVPDRSRSIREGAIAAWPGGWQGRNLQDIVTGLGHDIDKPWKKLTRRTRDWLLFTDEQPVVLVEPAPDRNEWPYNGRFVSARRHLLNTAMNSKSDRMRARALGFMEMAECPRCGGTGLTPAALAVTFAGRNIAAMSNLPITELVSVLQPTAALSNASAGQLSVGSGEKSDVAVTIARDLVTQLEVLCALGLGYLSLHRPTGTLSPGESQRLRIATQLRSGLFGVVYVLDEPSAGLHPADTESLLDLLDQLRDAGNSVFVVEHDVDIVRRADWIVDVGPGPGRDGGQVLYSGPLAGLRSVQASVTRRYLFGRPRSDRRSRRAPASWIRLGGIERHNLRAVDVAFPLGVFTTVTGVSGSGKSTLVTQVLADEVADRLGVARSSERDLEEGSLDDGPGAATALGVEHVDRLVVVDQRPIGRTPRSNLATYTGLFDFVRQEFAATDEAHARGYRAGRFSFNVPGGRCETCQGEGFVSVELLFLPSTYAPCPTCHGDRFNADTLEVECRGMNIAQVLALSVDKAADVFRDHARIHGSLQTLREVGLGYLRLGQPATELSGGEAQRIKLATELQRAPRGHTLYVLDEPTSGLHPADVELLIAQLHRLVDAGHTVIVVEHDMDVVASADWVIDLGPGAGDEGGRVVFEGTPADLAAADVGRTAPYLRARVRPQGRRTTTNTPV